MLKKNSQSSFKSGDSIEYEIEEVEKGPHIEIDQLHSRSNSHKSIGSGSKGRAK